MKNLVSSVCLATVVFGGTGCATYQHNAIEKKNDIVRYANGTVVDHSTYTDRSRGFALVGTQGYQRHYDSEVAVGTESHTIQPIPANSTYWSGGGYYGGYGAVGFGYGYPVGGYGYSGSVGVSGPYGYSCAPPVYSGGGSPIGNCYGYH